VYSSRRWASRGTVELRWIVCEGTELEVNGRVSCRELNIVSCASSLKYPPSVLYLCVFAQRWETVDSTEMSSVRKLQIFYYEIGNHAPSRWPVDSGRRCIIAIEDEEGGLVASN
jgi:hypothetical protein